MFGKHGSFPVLKPNKHGNIHGWNRVVLSFLAQGRIELFRDDFFRVGRNFLIHVFNFIHVRN